MNNLNKQSVQFQLKKVLKITRIIHVDLIIIVKMLRRI